MVRVAGLVGVAGLAGCLSTPDAVPIDALVSDAIVHDAAQICVDGDGDHWPAGEGGACATAPHLDCNDDDPDEHPGAYEAGDSVTNADCDETAWDGTGRMAEVVTDDLGGGSLSVTIGSLGLTIDDDAGHSISDLRVTPTDNLLYTGAMQERLIAIEAWSSFFSYEDAGTEDMYLEEVRARPLLRFQVDWTDGTDMEGLTTWTMHAGGRLYRREDAQLHQTPSASNVTSYVALDDSAITHVDFEGNGTGIPVGFGEGTFELRANSPGTRWLCAYHGTSDYEIGFLAQPTTSAATDGSRITWSQGNPDPTGASAQVALQYDWTSSGTPPLGAYTGNFQIVAGPNPGTPCSTVSAADAAWRNAPGLILRGGSAGTAPPGEDADGDGFAEGGGYWPVVAESAPFEIEVGAGTVSATVTLRIEGLPDGDPVISVEHERTINRYTHGRDYLLHQEAGFTWLVIRAIPGNVIHIVPPPVPPF